MGATKTEHFTDKQNEIALLTKTLGHPARINIMEYLMSVDTCICTDIVISMQLWKSVDFSHKLDPNKLNTIIKLSEKKLGIDDHKIEIEYQSETIGKYGVKFDNGIFILTCRNTAYLASDNFGIPSLKTIKEKTQSYCTPGGGCY